MNYCNMFVLSLQKDHTQHRDLSNLLEEVVLLRTHSMGSERAGIEAERLHSLYESRYKGCGIILDLNQQVKDLSFLRQALPARSPGVLPPAVPARLPRRASRRTQVYVFR